VKFEALVELSREAENNATSRELWRWSREIPSRGIEMLGKLGKQEKTQ
jgi:hypothetical protein